MECHPCDRFCLVIQLHDLAQGIGVSHVRMGGADDHLDGFVADVTTIAQSQCEQWERYDDIEMLICHSRSIISRSLHTMCPLRTRDRTQCRSTFEPACSRRSTARMKPPSTTTSENTFAASESRLQDASEPINVLACMERTLQRETPRCRTGVC